MPWLALLLACSQPTTTVDADALDHAVRASMAIRGVRPTGEELQQVILDPGALETLVPLWLEDPRFAETVRDQHALHLQLRTSNIGKVPPVGPLAGIDLGAIATSLDEAPLRLISDIVTTGRPYSEVLTTGDTWANDIVATVHGLAFDPTGPRWQRTRWADGRPAAGVLSDTAFNQRYMSSNTNFHRARAAAALSAFLCRDLLAAGAAVSAAPTLTDPNTAESAVRSDPNCIGCHNTLDVVASAFWGMHPYILSSDVAAAYRQGCPEGSACFPLPFWDPTQVEGWREHDLPAPQWRGASTQGLAELARALTADPDFADCTARRFHGWHTGRTPAEVPDDVAETLTDVLNAAHGDARALVAASVLHPDFMRAPRRAIRPEELVRTVEALTGYVWEGDPDVIACGGHCYGVVPLGLSDSHGFRTLLGGTDGWDVLRPATGSSPTQALALEWLADEAAHYVVTQDGALPAADRRLLLHAGPDPSMPSAVARQLAHLHFVILAEPVAADSPEVERTHQLFSAVEAADGSVAAWTAVISAMLRDHRIVVF
jgi:hypothetical protein